MKPLPRALVEATDILPALREGCGTLVRAGDRGMKDGIVHVDAAIGVETLRRAIGGGAAAFALAGWRTGADIQRLAALLSVAEAEEGRADGATPILAITDGILPAPVSCEDLAAKSTRLAALVWDQKVLKRTLGAERALTVAGEWTAVFAAARSAALLAAAAAGLPAYDSLPDRVGEALEKACERSRDDGFFGALAGNAAQVATIRTVYGRIMEKTPAPPSQ
ncbi:hypothetical protein AB3G45_15585 [Shinella sp. S4-D37]|uniref:hypothetical protein n=1 Tax=Shinella sp. S4-D37 TaxID=3161999 RepID=UPI0034654D10